MVRTNNSINLNSVASINGASVTANMVPYAANAPIQPYEKTGYTGFQYAYIPGRNAIINGDMQVWQYGGSLYQQPVQVPTAILPGNTGVASYAADRWQCATDNGALRASQIIKDETTYYCKVLRQAAGATSVTLGTSLSFDMSQPILASQVASLSFMAYAGADYTAVNNQFVATVYYTTAANPTFLSAVTNPGAFVALQTFTVQLTTTPQLFVFPDITIPAPGSLPNPIQQLAVVFSYACTPALGGADDSFYVGKVQFEASPQPTPFEYVPFNTQLARCTQFFYKTHPYNRAPIGNSGISTGITFPGFVFTFVTTVYAAGKANCNFVFPNEMVQTPICQLLSMTTGGVGVFIIESNGAWGLPGNVSGVPLTITPKFALYTATVNTLIPVGSVGTYIYSTLAAALTAFADVT